MLHCVAAQSQSRANVAGCPSGAFFGDLTSAAHPPSLPRVKIVEIETRGCNARMRHWISEMTFTDEPRLAGCYSFSQGLPGRRLASDGAVVRG